ncbi:MAG: hypothetical protein QXD66_04930 [Candidatus Nezhaarchaeales archaeon]
MESSKSIEMKCPHDKLEFLGDQKGEKGVNKYYKCLKCGNVLILSEEGTWYEVPATERQ